MNCQNVRELLVAYLDDELSPAERALVQEHLAGCETCRDELGQTWQTESRVRRTLQAMAAGAEPSPQAWPDLQGRLAARTTPLFSNRPGTITKNLTASRALAAAALVVLILAASIVGLVSPVRAQVVETVSAWLHIPMAGSHSGVMVSEDIVPFRPLAPTYLPEGYHNSSMLSGGAPGKEALELRVFSAERFVIFFEHQTEGEHDLPPGQEILVNGRPASLLTGLQGTANILAPAPQPDHAGLFAPAEGGGGGGGGGGGTDPLETLPDTITYADGVQVTWYAGDTRLEILSNEPLDEVLKIAGSMEPVEVIEGSLPLSEAPEASEEPGAPDSAAAPAEEAYIIQFPNGGGEWPVVGLDFAPYAPTYLPFDIMGGGGGGDGHRLTLVLSNRESFVKITQGRASADEPLPAGETVTVNGLPAVLGTGLAGTFEIGPPQPPISYADGVELTWQVGEIKIVLLSNLPVEEVLKVAGSMEPAPTGPLPPMPPVPPDGGGGGGGGGGGSSAP